MEITTQRLVKYTLCDVNWGIVDALREASVANNRFDLLRIFGCWKTSLEFRCYIETNFTSLDTIIKEYPLLRKHIKSEYFPDHVVLCDEFIDKVKEKLQEEKDRSIW